MKAWLKFILALMVAAAAVLAFRSLAFTIYTVGGSGLEPSFKGGDRILVNRWSYGLRTGSIGGLFSYGRLWRSSVGRGDIVAFDSPVDSIPGVFICRCRALPGDTLATADGPLIVPGLATCATEDHYWMEALGEDNPIDSRVFGFVPESSIIGRVCMIVYRHDDAEPFYTGYYSDRLLMIIP